MLAVGDLHFENFGPWRDKEGRLAWGINDFDEAFELPYTFDLVRLATSISLSRLQSKRVTLTASDDCSALLTGYTDRLKAYHGNPDAAHPIVLDGGHEWLRRIALKQINRARLFWQKLDDPTKVVPMTRAQVSGEVRERFKKTLPGPCTNVVYVHRTAGLGSLGRQRIVMKAEWHGGSVAREAKAIVPSACVWAMTGSLPKRNPLKQILKSPLWRPDPQLRAFGNWIIRRLSPDCIRIELLDMPTNDVKLLACMGEEAADLHALTPGAAEAILEDLAGKPSDWLLKASRVMQSSVVDDWHVWRDNFSAPTTSPTGLPHVK